MSSAKPCWKLRDKGLCNRINCPFSHDFGLTKATGLPTGEGGALRGPGPLIAALTPGRKGILRAISTYGAEMSIGVSANRSKRMRVDNEVEWCRGEGRGGPVFGPIWEGVSGNRDMIALLPPSTRGGARGKGSRVTSLAQLHETAWEEVPKPAAGYNYRAEVRVGDSVLIALLDTGASTNAIPEELVVALINQAYDDGKDPTDADWPVRLERWKGAESVTGVARGQDLTIVGAVVLPVLFTGLDNRSKVQKMRFKIFGKGCSGWMGLIIGGPSLEPVPLGLGLRTSSHGHFLQSLGLTVRRVEEREVSQRVDCFLAVLAEGNSTEGLEAGGYLEADLWADDSDCGESDGVEYNEDFTAGWMGGSIRLPTPTEDKSPVLCMAEDVTLGPGEAAWIPAAVERHLEGILQIMPNSCSVVCCANGVWDENEGLLLVTNKGSDVITLGAGDLVAAAWVSPSIEKSGDEFNHIIQNDALIERIFEVELPPEEYYDLLSADMRRRHPEADPMVLDHLRSLEPLADVAIATGFSFGATKALLVEPRIKLLGEHIDRYGRTSTDEHIKAITNWPAITEVGQLRQFLGTVNWVRAHLPNKFAQALKAVSPYLGKAEWPMNAAALARDRGDQEDGRRQHPARCSRRGRDAERVATSGADRGQLHHRVGRYRVPDG